MTSLSQSNLRVFSTSFRITPPTWRSEATLIVTGTESGPRSSTVTDRSHAAILEDSEAERENERDRERKREEVERDRMVKISRKLKIAKGRKKQVNHNDTD